MHFCLISHVALLIIDKAPISISLLPRHCALLPALTSPEASVPLVHTAACDTSNTPPSALSTSLASVQMVDLVLPTGTTLSLANMELTRNGLTPRTSRSQSLDVSSPKKSSAESKRSVKRNSLPRRRSDAKGSSEAKPAADAVGANVEVEEEVAGEVEEVDSSCGSTHVTNHRPSCLLERSSRARGAFTCQRRCLRSRREIGSHEPACLSAAR